MKNKQIETEEKVYAVRCPNCGHIHSTTVTMLKPTGDYDAVTISIERYEAYKKLAQEIYNGGAFSPYDRVIQDTRILFMDKKQFIKETIDEIGQELSKMFPWEQGVLIRAKITEVLAKKIGE